MSVLGVRNQKKYEKIQYVRSMYLFILDSDSPCFACRSRFPRYFVTDKARQVTPEFCCSI